MNLSVGCAFQMEAVIWAGGQACKAILREGGVGRRARVGIRTVSSWMRSSGEGLGQRCQARPVLALTRRSLTVRSGGLVPLPSQRRLYPLCYRRAIYSTNKAPSSTSPNHAASVPVEDVDEEAAKVGLIGKVKLVLKRYGLVAIVTYFGLYIATLSGVFIAIENDYNPFSEIFPFIPPPAAIIKKVTATLEEYSWSGPIVELIHRNPHVGNFVIAWVITKITEPARALITLAIVPRIARALGRAPPLPVKVKKRK